MQLRDPWPAPPWRLALLLSCSVLTACRLAGPGPAGAARASVGAGPDALAADGAEAFAGAPHLDRQALVETVLARSPELAAARAAVAAAEATARAAPALADPMLGYALAPLSVVGDAHLAQRVELRQRVPFPGKRGLAGAAATAMAEAHLAEVEVARLELAELASSLHDDYYLVGRALEINAHHRALVRELEESAAIQYAIGRGSAQDPLQARGEHVMLDRERVALEAERDVLTAAINGLLRRDPAAPLPPPPPALEPAPAPSASRDELLAMALARRPQRQVVQATARAAVAEVRMAEREAYPDLELMASWDSMWSEPAHQWMVGVMIDLPLGRGRRQAARDAAAATVTRRRHEDARLVDAIRVEVERAHRRVVEVDRLLALDEGERVPLARDRLDAARAGFVAGRDDFAVVVAAEQALREAELELERTRAERSRRRAALARAVGLTPGLPITEGEVR
ncbi:MAG: TolC family protein [Kofleriaceae bacterium]|nr:TolC family protein [Kofleriaceae bacterium]